MRMQRVLMAGLLIVTAWCGPARAEGMPEHVQKALNRFVGKWHSETTVDGKRVVAELEAEWSADKTTLNYRWKGNSAVSRAPTTSVGTVGWDGSRKLTVEKNFSADGSAFEATGNIAPGATSWTSPAEGTFAKSGGFAKVVNTRLITFKSDDECVVEDKDLRVDGKPEAATTVTWRRAKSEAARYLDFWKPMLGTWKSEADIAGKKEVGTARWELSPSKCCLISTGSGGGSPAGHSIEGYDPVLRAWKVVGFNEAGDSSTLVVHVANMSEMKQMQAGVKGTYEIYRSLANGTTETDTGNWSFPSWDEKQHVLELTNVISNGQKRPDAKIRYERQ